MRIQATDRRQRLWDDLKDATGESTKSGALDVASNYYVKMRGDTTAVPTGRVETLMRRADEQGSLTASEIAEVLDVDELPVDHSTTWSVGTEGSE